MDLAGSNENFRCDFISMNCFFLLLREIYLSLFTHTADLSHIGGSFLFICSICESPEAIISEVCRCFHSFLCCLKQSVNFVKMPSSVKSTLFFSLCAYCNFISMFYSSFLPLSFANLRDELYRRFIPKFLIMKLKLLTMI